LVNVGANTYTVAITQSEALSSIESQINAVSGLGSSGAVTASDDGSGHLVLTGNTNTTAFTVVANAESLALGVTTSASANNAVAPVSATRTTLQGNYNNILTQIDQLAGDSSYNGVNLLNGDSLKVLFNENGTSSLTISGVNFNSKGLGLSAASGTGFLDNNNITTSETAINAAITTVRAQTETFGTNSGTISTRQTFEQNMINTLQTGASNLVLADQNQESANLLTLQTRQQLEISALSIANQANQSVLKLFP
jgi:flagellin-like hook-associated protein FlgL